MRAAYITHTGPPDVIQVGDLPTPEPGPGQVRVRVKAVSLNPIDTYLRGGVVAMPLSFPYVIASDFAGVVDSLGPDVKDWRVGDRVWGSNQGLLGRQGVAAEFAVIDQEWLNRTPDGLDDPGAAAFAMVGLTAHLGLFDRAGLKAGETVYVPGGSGGVGAMVVQMAKIAGSRVATSAGAPERVDHCKALGADLALNYKTDDVAARLREFAPEGIDVWYETQREPDLKVCIPLLRKRGRLILMAGRSAEPVLPLGSFYPRDCSILGFAVFNAGSEVQRSCTADMIRWFEEGRLKPQIGRTFPLEKAVEAHQLLEANTLGGAGTLTGKVVLTVD